MEIHRLKKQSEFGVSVKRIAYKNPYDFSVYHRHDYFELFLFETGFGGIQNIDFETFKIKSKSMYFVVPGQVHLLNRKQNETGHLIQFTKSFLEVSLYPETLNIDYLMKQSSEISLSESQFNKMQSSINKLNEFQNSEGEYHKQKLKHQFALFIYEILELFKSNNLQSENLGIADRFSKLITQDVNKERSVVYYANLLEVSVNKLAKETKKALGKTPLKLIHEHLLLEIKRQMIFENKSHKELAFHFYFDDLSTYSRFIKKQTSLSPTELKKDLMKMVKSK
ncbi:MAG: helix-turn-helix domain-containing protein [Flavobacteriales bacterium]